MNNIKRLYRFLKKWIFYRDSPYCAICGSCGINGCCHQNRCKKGWLCEYPDVAEDDI